MKQYQHACMKGLRRGWLLACVALLLQPAALSSELPVKTVRVEGKFADVLDSIKGAIEGKGINIAHTLPASDMLNRTGEAFGITENVFIHAETVEFCSARISHQLARANPENLLLCPFTISVYVLTGDPQHVRVTYRRPYIMPDDDSRAAVADMVELIESIINEATAW